MKIFLPLCTALLLLAVAATLPVAAAEKQTASLREEMESLFQHLERKLSLQVEDAALATARQERRLTELENELKQLREEGESADAERRQAFSAFAAAEADKVKAASDRYTSLISAGFTALGALAALSVILPIILGYFGYRSFDREAKSKLEEMSKKLAEMETLVAKGHQHEQELKQLLQDNEPPQEQEKFSEDITQSAQKAVQKGVGVEALRGRAVLAQNAKDWWRACLYWEDVIKEDPSDKEARFFLAQCRTFLGSRGDVSPEQRTLLWKQAEDFYHKELAGRKDAQRAKILIAYAVLKREQAQFADSNSQERLYAEAEKLLLQVEELEGTYLLSFLATIKRNQAAIQSDPERRARLDKEAELLFCNVRNLAPEEGIIMACHADPPPSHFKLLTRAIWQIKHAWGNRRNPTKAGELAPQDAKSYVVLARFKSQQAAEQSDLAERMRLRAEAEQLLLCARELDPKRKEMLVMLATLKLEQARDAASEERNGLLAAAESYLDELLPQDSAKGLYNRACIATLRGQQERALELLEECRKAGTLLPREHLEKDKDMDSLRDLDAFREFLKRAYPDQPDNQANAPA